MKTKILDNEYWYGGQTHSGIRQPISAGDCATFDLTLNQSPNQAQPLFVSTKGRIISADKGFLISFEHGEISASAPAELHEGFHTLKGAYLAAASKLPFSKAPHEKLFSRPIFNTWIELTFYQNQQDVLRYARDILAHEMAPGVLMIDDGWFECNGDWRFHRGRFPDPEGLLRELHEMGFLVMVWVSPFVSPDTIAYRYARDSGLLVKEQGGEPSVVSWWNGCSAVLDLSNPDADKWLTSQFDELLRMGVDGFKLDAGDSIYYRADDITAGNVSPNEQSYLWGQFSARYPLNEMRVTFGAGGLPLLHRLCDKAHSWGEDGLLALIPDSLAAGITGHPFCCPDMIGGGEYLSFAENSGKLDAELFNRHSEIACLMPSMQFSAAPWRVLPAESFARIQNSVVLREQYIKEILELVENAKLTGEPVVRYMEYEFPGQGMERITDQFMLGSRLLVAPILHKGEIEREVILPVGEWLFGDVSITGGSSRRFTPPEGEPVVLVRQP